MSLVFFSVVLVFIIMLLRMHLFFHDHHHVSFSLHFCDICFHACLDFFCNFHAVFMDFRSHVAWLSPGQIVAALVVSHSRMPFFVLLGVLSMSVCLGACHCKHKAKLKHPVDTQKLSFVFMDCLCFFFCALNIACCETNFFSRERMLPIALSVRPSLHIHG